MASQRFPYRFILIGISWLVGVFVIGLIALDNWRLFWAPILGGLDLFFGVGGMLGFSFYHYLRFRHNRILNAIHNGEFSENIVLDREPYSQITKGMFPRLLLSIFRHWNINDLNAFSRLVGGTGQIKEIDLKEKLVDFKRGIENVDAANPPKNEQQQAQNADFVLQSNPELERWMEQIFPFKFQRAKRKVKIKIRNGEAGEAKEEEGEVEIPSQPMYAWLIHAKDSELIEGDPSDQWIVLLTKRGSLENEFLFIQAPDYFMGTFPCSVMVGTASVVTLKIIHMRSMEVEYSPIPFFPFYKKMDIQNRDMRIMAVIDSNAERAEYLDHWAQAEYWERPVAKPLAVSAITALAQFQADQPIMQELLEKTREAEDWKEMYFDKESHIVETGKAAKTSKPFKLTWPMVAAGAAALGFLSILFIIFH